MRSQIAPAITLAFALLAGSGSPAQEQPAQEQPAWELTGIVTYGSKPLKDAWVLAEGAPEVEHVRTDGQGRFTLRGRVSGTITIRAVCDGDPVEFVTRTVSVAAGARFRTDLAIPKGGVLSGRVLDRDKQPVRGLLVSAVRKSGDEATTLLQPWDMDLTNDLGEYRISHLPPGSYFLWVSRKRLQLQRRGWGPPPARATDLPLETFYPDATEVLGAVPLEVHAGEEITSLDLLVQKRPSHCVSFSVASGFLFLNDGKHPWTDVSLATPAGRNVLALESHLDDDVRPNEPNRICGLPAGEYSLRFHTLSGSGVLHVLGYLSVPFTVKDESVDLGSLVIPAPASASGSVSIGEAPQDAAIPGGIQVRLLSTESPELYHDDGGIARVQPDGSFQIPRVFPGDYAVRVSGLPAGYYVVDALQQGRSVRTGGFQANAGDLRILLRRDGATVSGRVLTADGSPVMDAAVVLQQDGALRPMVVRSDQTGAYHFATGVAPGAYRLAASRDLAGAQEQDATALARIAANGIAIELNSRESKIVDLDAQWP
jgi:hypothetical protein